MINKGYISISIRRYREKKIRLVKLDLQSIFVVTAIFTLIWGGAMAVWSILLCMIFAIVGAIVPDSMNLGISKCFDFIYKEQMILIVTGIVLLIIGIFIPVLIFALIGLIAGGNLSLSMKKKSHSSTESCDMSQSSDDNNSEE